MNHLLSRLSNVQHAPQGENAVQALLITQTLQGKRIKARSDLNSCCCLNLNCKIHISNFTLKKWALSRKKMGGCICACCPRLEGGARPKCRYRFALHLTQVSYLQ